MDPNQKKDPRSVPSVPSMPYNPDRSGKPPLGRQSSYGNVMDFIPRGPSNNSPSTNPRTAPAVPTPSRDQNSQPAIAKPQLQPQYQPKIPVKVPGSTPSAPSVEASPVAKPATTIPFHVPGVHPETKPAGSNEQPAITTFDRNAPPPVAERGSNPTGKRGQGLRDTLSIAGVLASALVLAFCLITFVFQSYQVDGPSMQTTLQNSDHLIVWKVQRTLASITHHPYIPNRGDVIVFSEPGLADYGQDGGKQLIKRVVGLPGERVTVKDGILTVYNKETPDGFQPDKTLPYGKVIVTTPGNVDVTLGDSQIFACGDNRTNSLDSRIFGPVDAKNIIGKLVVRVLPLNTVKKF
jgi:signal peptidase I